MQFSGRYIILAPPEAVWAALNDCETLKACIPGCEALAKADAVTFTGSVRLKIGPMSAVFKGRVEMADPDPPRRCILKGEGQGGVAGFARGESGVLLIPAEGGTALSYTAQAIVGGRLAQVGQRLLDSATRSLADEFFAKFAERVASTQDVTPATPEAALAPPPQVLQQGSESSSVRDGVAPEIWIVGLITIIMILLILFGLVL